MPFRSVALGLADQALLRDDVVHDLALVGGQRFQVHPPSGLPRLPDGGEGHLLQRRGPAPTVARDVEHEPGAAPGRRQDGEPHELLQRLEDLSVLAHEHGQALIVVALGDEWLVPLGVSLVPPREAVRLLYISKSRFGGDWRSVPHTHACTEMFYCVSGRGQFNIEGKLFDVAPDDLIIVNPRVQHTELSYQTYPLEYIVLGIDGAEFLFNEKDLGYTMLSCGMMREELLFLMRMLLREIDSRADGCEMVCQDILEVLLVKIVREAAVSMRIVQPPSKSKECAAAKRYIDENFSENITLDKLAEITHVNKYYLSHTFQREYNTSPINYLLNRRITESKALLTSTDFSLTQISEQMGFSSPAYFSQSFRRFTGQSPLEYRRKNQPGKK